MRFDDRVHAVAGFGFTPRQACFLVIVMLHAGVCLPRQYAAFAGIVHGQKTRMFFAKLVKSRYASAYRCRHNRGRIYQVHHKALYRVIGQTDSRHRRPLSPARVVRGLMLLDAVLAYPGLRWWEGTSDGQPGAARVQSEYMRILNSRFIRAQNQSVYQPQDKNPKGETHEDLAVFSFDTTRRRAIMRQFHVEGFVNQYAADLDSEPTRFVFTTEAIENIPPGWRARETYVVLGPNEFEEVFELAGPGKMFELYSSTPEAHSMTFC